ncbi:DUF4870 domain-containing protein [Rubrobacter marinus]|uniref:DUF4870 domain-containing protein n=1 Tax=Rubrobacter marinus TaxID=2653852 RepID=A0A6G8PZZ6_9ACTN|nr:DUF4870 domain-containing protein [Rubrobacter marinus]QIN79791.1 DUF4870 domain-containing protein [Rubrobacter marinus]
MEAEKQNYGMPEGSIGPAPGPQAMSEGEERTWSALAHLSVFANLFTGFLGPVVALVIWLVYKDRSERVAFQALQSVWYQVAWLAILGAGWVVTGVLTIVLIGFLLIPVMALVTLVPFVHGAYAAYKVNKYGEYRYPLIADLISR